MPDLTLVGDRTVQRRLLVPASALLWGLQLAFLSPALALILVDLYGATTAEVGWVLALYNASGFVFSLLLPARADRKADYLRPMLACGALTVLLAVALGATTSLPLATVALVVLGGPAGVGSTLLFAHLRAGGARTTDVVNTRAIVSVAWVAGPPLATLIIGSFGNRAILLAIAAVAVLNLATTLVMIRRRRGSGSAAGEAQAASLSADGDSAQPLGRSRVTVIVVAFVLLQAANGTAMTILTVYVTETLHLPVLWAGIALGIAAALEVPALILIGRLAGRHSHLGLILTSCVAGVAYYAGLSAVTGPVSLLVLQPLNAWAFAGIAGIGLSLFQEMIPRPGLATGLYMNTRRVGSIITGPLIAVGSLTALGQRGIFVGSAGLTLLGLLLVLLVRRPHPPESVQVAIAE